MLLLGCLSIGVFLDLYFGPGLGPAPGVLLPVRLISALTFSSRFSGGMHGVSARAAGCAGRPSEKLVVDDLVGTVEEVLAPPLTSEVRGHVLALTSSECEFFTHSITADNL